MGAVSRCRAFYLVGLGALLANGDIITYWSFDGGNVVPTVGSGTISALVATAFDPVSGHPGTAINSYSWSAVPLQALDFCVSTVAYTDIVCSADVYATGTGPYEVEWLYGTAGSGGAAAFTSVDSYSPYLVANVWLSSPFTVAFAGGAGENAPNFCCRLAHSLGGTGGNLRVDNVYVNGTLISAKTSTATPSTTSSPTRTPVLPTPSPSGLPGSATPTPSRSPKAPGTYALAYWGFDTILTGSTAITSGTGTLSVVHYVLTPSFTTGVSGKAYSIDGWDVCSGPTTCGFTFCTSTVGYANVSCQAYARISGSGPSTMGWAYSTTGAAGAYTPVPGSSSPILSGSMGGPYYSGNLTGAGDQANFCCRFYGTTAGVQNTGTARVDDVYILGYVNPVAPSASPSPTGMPPSPSPSPPGTPAATVTPTNTAPETVTPTNTGPPTGTPTNTAPPTGAPSGTYSATVTPPETPTQTVTQSGTMTGSSSPGSSSSATAVSTPTASITGPATPSSTTGSSPSATMTATLSQTATGSKTAASTPTASPDRRTPTTTATPTKTRSIIINRTPSTTPTFSPSAMPTQEPGTSLAPTPTPSPAVVGVVTVRLRLDGCWPKVLAGYAAASEDTSAGPRVGMLLRKAVQAAAGGGNAIITMALCVNGTQYTYAYGIPPDAPVNRDSTVVAGVLSGRRVLLPSMTAVDVAFLNQEMEVVVWLKDVGVAKTLAAPPGDLQEHVDTTVATTSLAVSASVRASAFANCAGDWATESRANVTRIWQEALRLPTDLTASDDASCSPGVSTLAAPETAVQTLTQLTSTAKLVGGWTAFEALVPTATLAPSKGVDEGDIAAAIGIGLAIALVSFGICFLVTWQMKKKRTELRKLTKWEKAGGRQRMARQFNLSQSEFESQDGEGDSGDKESVVHNPLKELQKTRKAEKLNAAKRTPPINATATAATVPEEKVSQPPIEFNGGSEGVVCNPLHKDGAERQRRKRERGDAASSSSANGDQAAGVGLVVATDAGGPSQGQDDDARALRKSSPKRKSRSRAPPIEAVPEDAEVTATVASRKPFAPLGSKTTTIQPPGPPTLPARSDRPSPLGTSTNNVSARILLPAAADAGTGSDGRQSFQPSRQRVARPSRLVSESDILASLEHEGSSGSGSGSQRSTESSSASSSDRSLKASVEARPGPQGHVEVPITPRPSLDVTPPPPPPPPPPPEPSDDAGGGSGSGAASASALPRTARFPLSECDDPTSSTTTPCHAADSCSSASGTSADPAPFRVPVTPHSTTAKSKARKLAGIDDAPSLTLAASFVMGASTRRWTGAMPSASDADGSFDAKAPAPTLTLPPSLPAASASQTAPAPVNSSRGIDSGPAVTQMAAASTGFVATAASVRTPVTPSTATSDTSRSEGKTPIGFGRGAVSTRALMPPTPHALSQSPATAAAVPSSPQTVRASLASLARKESSASLPLGTPGTTSSRASSVSGFALRPTASSKGLGAFSSTESPTLPAPVKLAPAPASDATQIPISSAGRQLGTSSTAASPLPSAAKTASSIAPSPTSNGTGITASTSISSSGSPIGVAILPRPPASAVKPPAVVATAPHAATTSTAAVRRAGAQSPATGAPTPQLAPRTSFAKGAT